MTIMTKEEWNHPLRHPVWKTVWKIELIVRDCQMRKFSDAPTKAPSSGQMAELINMINDAMTALQKKENMTDSGKNRSSIFKP